MQLKFLWEEIQSKSINIYDIYAMKDEVTIKKLPKKEVTKQCFSLI